MRGGFHGEHDGLGRVTCAGWLESKLPVSTTAPAEKTYATLSSKSNNNPPLYGLEFALSTSNPP